MIVVLASRAEPAADVVASLRAWSAAQMLERFVWWPMDPAVAGDELLAGIEVVDGAGDGADADDLLGAFGSASTDGAVVLVLLPDGVSPAEVAEPVQAARRHLQRVVGFVEVPVVGVLAPSADPKPVRLDGDLHWSALVALAPEDCERPGSANALVEHRDRYGPHVAAGIATVAGLWQAAPGREVLAVVLDRCRDQPPGTVQVLRCFNRVADGGYLVDHVAAGAMRPLEAWPIPRGRHVRRFDLEEQHRTYLVDVLFRAHEDVLGHRRIEPRPPDQPLPLLVALRRIVALARQTVLRYPVQLIARWVARAYDRGARMAEWVLQRFDPEREVQRWADVMATPTEPDDDMPEPPAVPPQEAVAGAWGDLRALCLGVMDGSDLPPYVTFEGFTDDHDRLVVDTPAQVAPDPRDHTPAEVARLLGVDEPRSCDPDRFDALLETATGVLAWLRARIALLEERADAGQGGEGSTDEEPVGEELDDLRRAEAALARDVGRLEDRLAEVEGSLLWAVARRLAGRIDEVRADAERAAVAVEGDRDLEQVAEIEQGSRRARWRSRLAGLAGLVVVGGLGWLAWTRLDGALRWLALGLLLAAAAVGVLARRARRVARRRQEGRDLEALRVDRLRAERYPGELERLSHRYVELLDWAEVVGWLVHRPWVGGAEADAELPEPIDPETLPVAFRAATAVVERRTLDGLVNLARRDLFDRGWLTGVYRAMDQLVEVEVRRSLGVEDPAEQMLDPAADTSDEPDWPRRTLLRLVRQGDQRSDQRARALRRVTGFLAGRTVDELFCGVEPLGDEPPLFGTGPGALPPISAWRSEPTGLEELAERVRPAVVRIDQPGHGGSGVVVDEAGTIVTNRHVVPELDEAQVRLHDGTDVEAEVVWRDDRSDLALLRARSAVGLRYVALDQADELVQGQPLFTLGHPMLLEGDPTLAHGIVSALDRTFESDLLGRAIDVFQHSVPTRGGASGSAVFDLAGTVVGVHVGGIGESEYLKLAIPAAEVRRVVEAWRTADAPSAAEDPEVTAAVPVAAGAPVAVVEPAGARRTVSAFFAPIEGPAGDHVRLSYLHWADAPSVDRPEAAQVDRALVVPPGAPAPEPSFGRPWRAHLSRVELVPVGPVTALAWVDGDEQDEVDRGERGGVGAPGATEPGATEPGAPSVAGPPGEGLG